MTHRYIKMGATVTVLTLAFAGLLWSTLREGTEYFKNIDEVVSTQGATNTTVVSTRTTSKAVLRRLMPVTTS